jgi:hypothetical protein
MMIETCPYCRETIDAEDVIRCPSCGTPHHNACFAENGGCTVFGCESAPVDESKIRVELLDVPTSAPPPPFSPELQFTQILYFVNRSGEELGPYSLSELQHHVEERRLAGTDLAWSEGMPQWVFICDILGGQAIQARDPLDGRMCFGRGRLFLGLISLFLIGSGFLGFKDTEALGIFIFVAGFIVIAILRVRDVGMSGWTVLLAAVPIGNLFLCYRLLCAPRDYEITRRADTAMEVICWSLGGLVVLGIVIAILSSITR